MGELKVMAAAIEAREQERVTDGNIPLPGLADILQGDIETPGEFEQDGGKTILLRHKEIADRIEPAGIWEDPWVRNGTIGLVIAVLVIASLGALWHYGKLDQWYIHVGVWVVLGLLSILGILLFIPYF